MKALHDYVKPGVIHFMAYPATIGGDGPAHDTMLEIVKDDFFDCIEITRVNDKDEAAKVKTLLDASGMTVGFGAQPIALRGGLDMNSLDEEKRVEAVDAMKKAIDQAYYFGAGKLGFITGKVPEDRKDVDKALEALTKSVIEMGHYAMNTGTGDLVLSLETFDGDTDKKALLGTNRLAVEVSREVRQHIPTFGLMLDLSHIPMQGETITEALTVARDHINHAHIGTCVLNPEDPFYGDKHTRFGYENAYVTVEMVRDFFAGLLDIGYLSNDGAFRNVVSMEVMPMAGTEETTQGILGEGKRWMREAWRLL